MYFQVMELLLEKLKHGNRLSCPSACDSQIYKVMLQCWEYSPERRPLFADVNKQLQLINL